MRTENLPNRKKIGKTLIQKCLLLRLELKNRKTKKLRSEHLSTNASFCLWKNMFF